MTAPILTAEHLRSLKAGDVFSSEGLFQGCTDEPLEWRVTGIPTPNEYTLEVRYFNVRVAEFAAILRKRAGSEYVEIDEL